MSESTQRQSGVAVGAMAFVMLFSYAIVRPASESLFLAEHGSHALPAAWIGVALGAALAVAAYNRLAARRELMHVLWACQAVSAASLAAVLLLRPDHRGAATFLLYVWKDVHIVVLLEALWSFANVVFSTDRARVSYGLFCAAGSLGGICGNLLVGRLAQSLTTERVLWLLLPAFALQAAMAGWLGRVCGRPRPPSRATPSLGEAWRVMRSSSYLLWLLALVGLVQLVVNLVDFQYNSVIEATYPDTDVRTAMAGRIYASIDALSLLLQLSTGLLLKLTGLRRMLLAIPVLVAAGVGWFAALPSFAAMATAKVASKVLDYSVFRAAKEMLYIPLSYEEKTRGKAFIDMLTYRVSKAGASLVLRGLMGLGASAAITWATLALIAGWLGVTVPVTRRYRRVMASVRSNGRTEN